MYFSCSFFISGASCFILMLVSACLRLTGNITPRTISVRQTMHRMYGMNSVACRNHSTQCMMFVIWISIQLMPVGPVTLPIQLADW